ncbi:MAG: hypothetical protein ACLQMH_01940, partial [Solirubrobacteraceae bacterium]
LSGRLKDAQGDVRAMNIALREHFDRFYLHDGGEWIVPVLSDAASWQVPAERIADGSLKVNAEEHTVSRDEDGELRITPTGRVFGVAHAPDGAPELVKPHALSDPSRHEAKSATTKKLGLSW